MKNQKTESQIAGIMEEYSQVRSMLEKSCERQDTYFLSSFTILGVGNIFQKGSVFYLGITLLCISLFINLKIIECRNMTFYNTTYLVTFLEDAQYGLLYETRIQKLRGIFWKDKSGITQKNIYNRFYRFGYYIKNGIICIMVIFLAIQTTESLLPIDTVGKKLKLFLVIIITVLNLVYSYVLLNDRFLTGEFLKKWKKIKEEENT
ncbi:MAG: hypothetical protein MJ077_05555 [Oscillospiraceae bacterium]|nr:hypothetical protein [Oscillospiraceae bacterium]